MPPLRSRSAILVPLIGASLVWYNFHLFGSLATPISSRFFSKGTPTLTAMAYFSPFVIGLIVRPIGALLFGRVGDRKGRKRALSQALFLTGIATLLLGMLPGYRIIGVTAPVGLLALRLLQGLAFGSVHAGAVLYAAECAPEHRRGFSTSWIQMAPALGLLLSLALISVIRHILGYERFDAYGWRLAFLPSLILVGLSLYLRRMEETPAYRQLQESGTAPKRWLLDGWRNRNNLKLILTTLCVAAGQAAIWYMAQFYVTFHLQNVLRVNPFTATCVVAIALLLGLPFFVYFGALSDKIGRKKIMLSGCLLAAVLYIPIYAGMQRAADTHVVTIRPVRNFVTGAHGPTPLTLTDGVFKPAVESPNPNLIALTALVLLQIVILSMVSGPLGAYFAEVFPSEVRFTFTALSYSLAHGVMGSLLPFFSLPLLVTSGDIYAGLYYAVAVTLVSFLVGVFTVKETIRRAQSGEAGSAPSETIP